MRRFRLALLALFSLFLATLGSTLKKALTISLCGVLLAGSSLCYSWENSHIFNRVEAAVNSNLPPIENKLESTSVADLPLIHSQSGANIPVTGIMQILDSQIVSCSVGSYEIEGYFNSRYTGLTIEAVQNGEGCFNSLPIQLFDSNEFVNSGDTVVYSYEDYENPYSFASTGQLTMFGDGLFTGGFFSGRDVEETQIIMGSLSLNTKDVVLNSQKIPGSVSQLDKEGNSLAIANLPDVDVIENAFSEEQWTLDETGLTMARNLVDVMLLEDATVNQLNRALKAVGGTIVSSLQDLPGITLAIPDTGDFGGLERAESVLNLAPGVAFTSRELKHVVPELEERLLVIEEEDDTLATSLKSKQDVKQAFSKQQNIFNSDIYTEANCKRPGDEIVPTPLLLEGLTNICGELWKDLKPIGGNNQVDLYVYDFFDNDTHGDLNLDFIGDKAEKNEDHGYMVSGLMAAKSGNNKGVIGAYPNPANSRPIQAVQTNLGRGVNNGLLSKLRKTFPTGSNFQGKRAVINHSIGLVINWTAVNKNSRVKNEVSDIMARVGAYWSSQVRSLGKDIEDHLLIVASAGNDGSGVDAEDNSQFSAAGLKTSADMLKALKNQVSISVLQQLQSVCESQYKIWWHGRNYINKKKKKNVLQRC